LIDTSCGKWYEQKEEAEYRLSKYPLCHQTCASWGSARARATKEYNLNLEMEEEDTEKTGLHKEEPTDPGFQVPASGSPHKLTQNELNDLVCNVEQPKVASRMKQWKY
jgi:hypothetical protein